MPHLAPVTAEPVLPLDYEAAVAFMRHPPALDAATLAWVDACLRVWALQSQSGPHGMAGFRALSQARRQLIEAVLSQARAEDRTD